MNFSICKLAIHEIEKLQCDSISIFIFQDMVPLQGMAGIIDWRLNGVISKFLIEETIGGKENENFLIPMRPRMPIEKLFGFGLGKVGDFSVDKVEDILRGTLGVLNRAAVHSTAMMLPGRCEELYSLEKGVSVLRSILGKKYDLDELVIADRFENPEKDLNEIIGGLDLG